MQSSPKPPETFQAFIARFPKLGQAWEKLAEAGREGPLDPRTERLVKLAVAVGALREGAVHSSVRKALASGITAAEVEQVMQQRDLRQHGQRRGDHGFEQRQ